MMGPSAHPGKKLSPPQTARALNPKTVKPQPQVAHPPKTLDICKTKDIIVAMCIVVRPSPYLVLRVQERP